MSNRDYTLNNETRCLDELDYASVYIHRYQDELFPEDQDANPALTDFCQRVKDFTDSRIDHMPRLTPKMVDDEYNEEERENLFIAL